MYFALNSPTSHLPYNLRQGLECSDSVKWFQATKMSSDRLGHEGGKASVWKKLTSGLFRQLELNFPSVAKKVEGHLIIAHLKHLSCGFHSPFFLPSGFNCPSLVAAEMAGLAAGLNKLLPLWICGYSPAWDRQ